MIDHNVIKLVREFLTRYVREISLPILTHVRTLAIRYGSWWRVNPFRRALIDVAIAYLRSGFIIRSTMLVNMLRDVIIDVLINTVVRRLSFIAYVIGIRLGGFGNPIIAGLQWLNRPVQYRWLVK
ncbi:hypothetical protein [Vulcanisaeta distributa]|uniref:Uncharacterized protein n=1 Tax=Vulcanisaeta distributa (strain DSM 14429 / JCM 11212 / NBRC 100878 / IC-017) TaxID=572478 RepID=E1QUB8_VULDI|nr:hypothetical protein [Vulcanisaeta distributa]ADN49844.1 conserved hypothetical protein [Vulcanisaeta distributa DSM 14429]